MATSNSAGRHLAVIPARGGSKRLPRKNIADFLGKPIIAHTIEAAREAALFERILVSTEDSEIAAIAKQCNAEVDDRPKALAEDQSTVVEVCIELLDRMERGGERFESLTVLYATAPLRSARDIRATHELLARGQCEFAMAVTEFQQSFHQALTEDQYGKLNAVFPEKVNKRPGANERYFAGNGSTYSVFVDSFRIERGFYGHKLRGHLMPPERSVDIDDEGDLELAKFYARKLLK